MSGLRGVEGTGTLTVFALENESIQHAKKKGKRTVSTLLSFSQLTYLQKDAPNVTKKRVALPVPLAL